MRARTKEEKLIVELASKLKPLSEAQKKWAVKNVFESEAWASKKTLTCMECGHQWKRNNLDEETCKCPHCGQKLQVKEQLKRKDKLSYYYGIITTCKGYQLFRLFMVDRYYSKGEKVQYFFNEAVQKWINEKGRDYTLARNRRSFSMYYDDWIYSQPMTLKSNIELYDNFTQDYYPRIKIIDSVIRNGYRTLNVSPVRVVKNLLSDSRMETLLKLGYSDIFEYFICSRSAKLSTYWDSIRICLKHNYHIEDFPLWKDYVDMLIKLKKDIRNPKFICPKNFQEEHNKLLVIIQKKEAREREIRERQRIIARREAEEKRYAEEKASEKKYLKQKSKYLNLVFTDGELTARPLQCVKEFLEKGNAMHHCVFTCRYYEKVDSLIFSVTCRGNRVETVEVSLKTGKVIQCYGKFDKFTERHQQVLDLMERNTINIMNRVNLKNVKIHGKHQVLNAS